MGVADPSPEEQTSKLNSRSEHAVAYCNHTVMCGAATNWLIQARSWVDLPQWFCLLPNNSGSCYTSGLLVLLWWLAELRIQFAQFDRDGDGIISQHELSQVMASLGLRIDSDTVRKILSRADVDGCDFFIFDCFCFLEKVERSVQK